MPQVLIKMIDGTNIVTDCCTLEQVKTYVKDGQVDPNLSIVDIPDIGGQTVSMNTHRVSYIKEIPNT